MHAPTNFFLHPNQLYPSFNQHQQQQQQNQQQPPPPPPTTPTTLPKRTYVTRACDHCRQRRAVCDNQKPKCSRCTKKKIDCTFLVPQRKRGPTAKTKGDSGLDPNQEQETNVDLKHNNDYNNYTYSNSNNTYSNSNSNNSNNNNINSDSSGTNNSSPSIISLDIISDLSFVPSNNGNNNNNSTPSTNMDNNGLVPDFGLELGTDSEAKEDEEGSLFRQFIRSPSGTPWPAANDPLESYYPYLASPIDLSYRQPLIHDDIFSKPAIDHLVALFFEHCFQDFDFFSPLAFLRLYVQGAANPSLLDMVCGIGSRYSDHPAVAKNPPYSSGEPYVDRVKANMPELVADASMDTMHTLILLTHYEYSVGRHGPAYRIECLSAVMASDLQLLHYYQQSLASSTSRSTPSSSVSHPSDFLHNSEADRVAIEVKIRTLTSLLISDLITSAISGLAPKFDHSTVRAENPSSDICWWMERPQEPGGIPFEPVDDFSASILHKVMLPRPVPDLNRYVVVFLDLFDSIREFVRTEYTLEKWKRHMDAEAKGGSESRVSFRPGSTISAGSNASSVSMSMSMSLSSSSSATAITAGTAVAVVDQSETFQQSGSLSVPDHYRHHQQQHLLSRELSSIATTIAPLSTNLTPVGNFSAIPTTTADVLLPSPIPRPVTPPPSVNPPRPVPDVDTSPQRKSDLSEETKLDSEIEQWKAQIPLEFVPHHVRVSVFETNTYYALAILIQRPFLIPGVFLTDTSSFESNINSSGSINERNLKPRGGRQRSRSSRGGVRRGRGSYMERTGSCSCSSEQQLPQQQSPFAEEMEGVVFTESLNGGEVMESSATMSALAIERTPLDKCTELANKVSATIAAFPTEQIKYRGHTLSLQVFHAATIHLTNMMTSKDAMVIARSRERLDKCYHFLDTLKPYWAAAGDQMSLLHGLLSSRDLRE